MSAEVDNAKPDPRNRPARADAKDEAMAQAAELWAQVAEPSDFDDSAARAYIDDQLDADDKKAFESLMRVDPRIAAKVDQAKKQFQMNRVPNRAAISEPDPAPPIKLWWKAGWLALTALVFWILSELTHLL